MKQTEIIQHLLKSYDIRGSGSLLLNGGVEAIAPAILKYFKEIEHVDRIMIGSDMRQSSPRIVEVLTELAINAGLDVILLQEKSHAFVSTPFLYYTASLPQYADCASIMVTASHNPETYNGMKMTGKRLRPIAKGSGLETIRRFALENTPLASGGSHKTGKIHYTFPHRNYLMHALELANVETNQFRGMKIFIDGLNGMAPQDLLPLMDMLGVDTSGSINCDPGNPWPSDRPDPMFSSNHDRLKRHMQNGSFDLGFMGDGDFDRIFLFSDTGEMIGGDFLTALLAEHYGASHARIGTDMRARLASKKMILASGSIPLDTRIGYTHIKDALYDYNRLGEYVPFGGEVSGHFYFRNEQGMITENTLFVVLQALKRLRQVPGRLQQILSAQNSAFHSGEMLFHFRDQTQIRPALHSVKHRLGQGADIHTEDRRGVDLEATLIRQNYRKYLEGSADDFLNIVVRLSGAEENMVKSTIEADSQARLDRYVSELISILDTHTGYLIDCAKI